MTKETFEYPDASLEDLFAISQREPALLLPARKKFWQKAPPRKGVIPEKLCELLSRCEVTPEFLTLAVEHPWAQVRKQVALHKNTPLSVLEKLLKEDDYVIRRSVVENTNCPLSLLKKVAEEERSVEVLSALAQRADLNEEILRILLREFNVHHLIAQHPNTPEWLQERLCEEGAQRALLALASSPRTSTRILEKVFDKGSPPSRAAVVNHPNVTEEIIAKALDDSEEMVRVAALGSPWTRQETLFRFVKNGTTQERLKILASPYVTTQFIDVLIYVKSEEIFLEIAKHPKTTPEQLKKIIESTGSVKVLNKIVERQDVTPEILHELSKDSNDQIRLLVSRKENLLDETCHRLALDSVVVIRENIASRPTLPIEAMKVLIGDLTESVRSRLLCHHALPKEIQTFLEKVGLSHDLKPTIESEAISPEALSELMLYGSWIRYLVAKNRNTPYETLQSLAKDPSEEVREAVSSHPALYAQEELNLPPLQGPTVTDGDRTFTLPPIEDPETASRNFYLSPALLERFSQSLNPNVRRNVAQNPTTPTAILEVLSLDSSAEVRQAVVANQNTSAFVLLSLSQDKDAKVRAAAQRILQQQKSAPTSSLQDPFNDKRGRHLLSHAWRLSEQTLRSVQQKIERNPSYLRRRTGTALQWARTKPGR